MSLLAKMLPMGPSGFGYGSTAEEVTEGGRQRDVGRQKGERRERRRKVGERAPVEPIHDVPRRELERLRDRGALVNHLRDVPVGLVLSRLLGARKPGCAPAPALARRRGVAPGGALVVARTDLDDASAQERCDDQEDPARI
jgi:hypothetical protein